MASENQSSDFGRRYQTLPSSAVVRPSPARRVRATIPSNTLQICQESAHYPVFNPLDPRHNPTAPASLWLDGPYYPPEVPSNPGSEGWMQSLSRRSIRKARSGLLTIRSGMQRRPLVDAARRNGEIPRSSPWPEEHSDQKENIFPSTVSEASTEEDIDFGSHLHRTKCKSSPLTQSQERPMPRSRFSTALADLSPFARRSEETPVLLGPALTELTSNTRVHESANEDAEGSAISGLPVNRETETGDLSAAASATESNANDPRPSGLPRSSGCSDLSGVTVADTASLVRTSSSNDGSETGRVDKRRAYSHRVAHPSLDRNSSQSSSHSAHAVGIGKAPSNEDKVVPARPQESNLDEVDDIDLMMDTLGALDRLVTQDIPNTSRADPGSNESSPGSLKRTNAGFPHPSRSSSTEIESRRSNGEAEPNGSCNIRIQVQSGDWSRSLSPVPESADLVDSTDFFGDQAAWSNRPSEEATTTDITSVSNVLWSPVENDDLTSVGSLGDEYFLFDGKTSGYHPDRGNNPTKAERRLVSENSLCSDPSLERNSSVRTQDIPEVIGPSSPMLLSPSGPRRQDRNASDSTDEYLVTYPMFLRRYLS